MQAARCAVLSAAWCAAVVCASPVQRPTSACSADVGASVDERRTAVPATGPAAALLDSRRPVGSCGAPAAGAGREMGARESSQFPSRSRKRHLF